MTHKIQGSTEKRTTQKTTKNPRRNPLVMHHTEFIMLDYDHSIGGTFGMVYIRAEMFDIFFDCPSCWGFLVCFWFGPLFFWIRCVALHWKCPCFFFLRDAVSISQCFLVHFFIFPDIFVFEFTVFYGKYFESDIGAEWTGIPPCGTVKDPTNGVTRKPFPPLRSSSALLDPHEERDGVLPFPTGFATLVPFEHECLSE